MKQYTQIVISTVIAFLIGWAGLSIEENGKSIARMEVTVAYLSKQIDNMAKDRFANLMKEKDYEGF